MFISDFEDMSCEMVYGQVPPPFEEDPVSKQPCYADICKFVQFMQSMDILTFFCFLTIATFAGSISNPSSSVCPKLQAWDWYFTLFDISYWRIRYFTLFVISPYRYCVLGLYSRDIYDIHYSLHGGDCTLPSINRLYKFFPYIREK